MTPAVETAIELPKGGKTIQLVKELDYTLPSIEKKAVTPKRAAVCYVAGPYNEADNATNLLSGAVALGFNGKTKALEVVSDEPSEYWVRVSPRTSREAVMRTLIQLHQKKIDSCLVTQGELADGISVGLFRNKDSAYGLQDQIKSLAIPAEVRVINKNTTEYWVEIIETAQLNEALRTRIQAQDQKMRWELVECSK